MLSILKALRNVFSGSPCNDAYSFCGLKDQKYPDTRAMGYPFDKSSRFQGSMDVDTLSTFVSGVSNAALGEISIIFNNTVIKRQV